MTTKAITPLRQRMIEDMNARKLCAGTQRGHIRSCKRFAAFLKRSPDTATLEDIRRFQLHLADTGVSICTRNCIMTGLRFLFRITLRRLDLAEEVYHIREPEKLPLVMSVDEMKRLLAVAVKPQDACSAQPRLWLRITGERDRAAQGQAYRQSTEYHSHRAVEGSQGPQCDAAAGDAWLAAAMVEGASLASRCGNTATGALAVSQQKVCWQANDYPPAQPLVSRSRRRCGDQEGRDAAYVTPQLRHPPARSGIPISERSSCSWVTRNWKPPHAISTSPPA